MESKPFLKWAGGKGKLIKDYLPYFPEVFGNYYEPFLGGGAIYYHLKNSGKIKGRAFLSDINTGLIDTYKTVRDRPFDLIILLRQHKLKHSPSYYKEIRAITYPTPLERAAQFIYLNKSCFNGLYRENKQGGFNVPIGRYADPLICDEAGLVAASMALQSATIHSKSFHEALTQPTAGDLVFLDPPYAPIEQGGKNFKAYTKYPFGDEQQRELRDKFAELSDRGCFVMAANSYSESILSLYSDRSVFGTRLPRIIKVMAGRSINSKGGDRVKVGEALILGWQP